MRTTLDIDEDVLAAAKEIAKAERSTTGRVISDLARKALTIPATSGFGEPRHPEYRGGFRLMPRTGKVVTPELVEKLLDEDT